MIAHIRLDGEQKIVQTVKEHTQGVVSLAKTEGEKVNIGSIVSLAALFHDEGKEKKEFQNYIISQANNTQMQKGGTVNHSSIGAYSIYSEFHNGKASRKYLAEIISYAIAAHHGIFDCVEQTGKDKFTERVENTTFYNECHENHIKDILCDYDINELFEKAYDEFMDIKGKIDSIKTKEDWKFYYGCLQRLVLSILIDADWTDTAVFVNAEHLRVNNKFSEMDLAQNNYNMYIEKLQNDSNTKILTDKQKQIKDLRNAIQKECITFGKNPAGIYRLPIPTGGGKTLSGLGYALEYAKQHTETERIFYISPFISITEQNATVIKEAVGNQEWVLEHHSNVIQDQESKEGQVEQVMSQLAINWEEPFICTTMVQFLNTLFSERSQSIRRFHRLKNSVVIIDEVQSLPLKTIHTFNLMMNFLKTVCSTDVILCTATQPLLENVKRPILYNSPKDMISDVTKRFEQFERVEVISKLSEGALSYEKIATMIGEKFEIANSILVILNSKYAVQMLYDTVTKSNEWDVKTEYLTTNLCAQHRSKKIENIKKMLKEKKKVLIISTNLIEAGVDISVECVIRSLAGLDSIAQAAGRCNRNGECEKGTVYVIRVDDEKTNRMLELKEAIEASELIFYNYEEEKDSSLLSPRWMELYYKQYFMRNIPKMDFNVKIGEIDDTIFNLLKTGFKTENSGNYMHQAYKTAGHKYEVINDNGVEVIVPYEKGQEFINQLESTSDLFQIKNILKKIQRYTVTVHNYQINELEEKGVIRLCENVPNIYIAMNYDDNLGIVNKFVDLVF